MAAATLSTINITLSLDFSLDPSIQIVVDLTLIDSQYGIYFFIKTQQPMEDFHDSDAE